MKNGYATAYDVCATGARLPPAPFIFAFVASISLRVALLTGAADQNQGSRRYRSFSQPTGILQASLTAPGTRGAN